MKYIENLRLGIKNCIESFNAILLGEDVAEPYGGAFKVTKGLSDKYPSNVISTPMSEQGFTAMGIGCALTGQPVLIEIMFCDFITLIADQVINHAAKLYEVYGKKIPIVIRTPSGGYRGYGATHSQCMERIFVGIPGLQILVPSILHAPGKMLEGALETGMPTLFIENKNDYNRNLIDMNISQPVFKFSSYDFFMEVIIKGEVSQGTIITYGGMASICIDVLQDLFFQEEISLQLLVINNLCEAIESVCCAIKSKKILFVEEGWELFGIGSEYVAKISQKGLFAEKMGALHHTILSGKRLENELLPNYQSVAERIKEVLKK